MSIRDKMSLAVFEPALHRFAGRCRHELQGDVEERGPASRLHHLQASASHRRGTTAFRVHMAVTARPTVDWLSGIPCQCMQSEANCPSNAGLFRPMHAFQCI
eukprot:6214564-Pleurochrysis_carterae.AAC.3